MKKILILLFIFFLLIVTIRSQDLSDANEQINQIYKDHGITIKIDIVESSTNPYEDAKRNFFKYDLNKGGIKSWNILIFYAKEQNDLRLVTFKKCSVGKEALEVIKNNDLVKTVLSKRDPSEDEISLMLSYVVSSIKNIIDSTKPRKDSCVIGDYINKEEKAIITISENKKSISKYSSKEIFLTSDENWKDVLPFIPVAIWTEEKTVKKYPILIYHKEESGFDADSIIYFMQQYNPERVTIIGETPKEFDNLLTVNPSFGAGLNQKQINRIYPKQYLSYWESFDTVVYVEDDYELALLASTFASLINAPLIIEGTTHDSKNVFKGRNVICVGFVIPDGSHCYMKYHTLGQLQQTYKSETNTDKIILINPNDWDIAVNEVFENELGVYNIYTKISLMAPILASAKHELILSTTKTDYVGIDSFLELRLSGINYLTIMAAPNMIPYRKYVWTIYKSDYKIYKALDPTLYADTNDDLIPDIATGRIMGISSSDVSSYIARDLFYNTFSRTNNIKFLASSYEQHINSADKWSPIFSDSGYNAFALTSEEDAYDFNPVEWKNQDLISYNDHGFPDWAGISSNEIPLLDNSVILNDACLTCSTYDGESFCNRAIRQGALAHIGAVCIAFTENPIYMNTINYIYLDDDMALGDAFKFAYRHENLKDKNKDYTDYYMVMLLGDPTLDINPPYKLDQPLYTTWK